MEENSIGFDNFILREVLLAGKGDLSKILSIENAIKRRKQHYDDNGFELEEGFRDLLRQKVFLEKVKSLEDVVANIDLEFEKKIKKRLKGSEGLFSKGVSTEKKSHFCCWAALGYLLLNDEEKTRDWIGKAKEFKGDLARPVFIQGLMLGKRGAYAQAKEHFKKAKGLVAKKGTKNRIEEALDFTVFCEDRAKELESSEQSSKPSYDISFKKVNRVVGFIAALATIVGVLISLWK